MHSDLKPDVYKCGLRVGDKIVLYTDGLTRHLADAEVINLLQSEGDIEEKIDEIAQASEGLLDRAKGTAKDVASSAIEQASDLGQHIRDVGTSSFHKIGNAVSRSPASSIDSTIASGGQNKRQRHAASCMRRFVPGAVQTCPRYTFTLGERNRSTVSKITIRNSKQRKVR